MKKSTMVALCLGGALAFALTGCMYDNAAEGADVEKGALIDGQNVATDENPAGPTDVPTAANPDDEAQRLAAERAAAEAAAAAKKDADVSSLADATGVPFDQDPNYARCTDVDFQPVYFGFDQDALAASEQAKVEAVAQHLMQNAARVVIVEGNCDERGSNEYNLGLGENRAIKIHDYLVKLGIADARIQTKSYGEERPAVQGSNEAAWSKNRRGEFAIYQHK